MARLVVLSEGLTGVAHELKVDKTTVGRVEDNTFQIPEASVSSHHAEILLRGTEIIFHDLNSTNGSFINGQRISGESPLKPGQILRLGNVEMRLEDADSAKAAAAKKLPDQTMVIPQGVKLGGADQGTKAATFDKSAFTKKSNNGTKIFIIVAVVVGLAIVAFVVMSLMKTNELGK